MRSEELRYSLVVGCVRVSPHTDFTDKTDFRRLVDEMKGGNGMSEANEVTL